MRTLRKLGLRHDLGVGDRHDAEAVGVGDVDERSVGLDDVAFVDAHLLGVGPRVVDPGGRRRRDGSVGSSRTVGGGTGLGDTHIAADGVSVAAETPRGDACRRLGLHVVEQGGTVAEELQS